MKVIPHPKFEGVFLVERAGRKRRLATQNLVPGFRSYDDEVVMEFRGREYRVWPTSRSKPSAAIQRGLRNFPIRRGVRILYLGIASGTTASHFSDIVGREGIIYGVEVAHRVLIDLLPVARARKNIVPILANARRPEEYSGLVEEVDVVYADVAQPDQDEILLENCEMYLKRGGVAMIAVKASSIDVTLPPKKVYTAVERKMVEGGLRVLERVDLSPTYPKHAMIVAKKVS